MSRETLELLRIGRCADLCDALDSMGVQDTYELGLALRPLFPGIRFAGIAQTQEFQVFDRRMPELSYDEFDSLQYQTIDEGATARTPVRA